jgi:hypothetical protein
LLIKLAEGKALQNLKSLYESLILVTPHIFRTKRQIGLLKTITSLQVMAEGMSVGEGGGLTDGLQRWSRECPKALSNWCRKLLLPV